MTDRLDTAFHALHADGVLLLANAWDAGSARLAHRAGARAVATSSAAVAWSHGWPDGDLLPAEFLLQTVRAVVGAVDLPVSVDVEGGYSDDPARVGELVSAVVEAGAVGINIEDGAGEPELLCAKIAAARRAAEARGVNLYINARTDVYLRALAEPALRATQVLARAERYRAAGANGLFVPGVVEEGDIATIVGGTGLPVNVMAWSGLPALDRLRSLGVRRLSAGSAIAEAMHGQVAALMRDFMETGRVEPGTAVPASYRDIQSAMARR